MVTDDLVLLNRHLKELRQEVAQLRHEVDHVAHLAREAAYQEVLEILQPVLEQLTLLTAQEGSAKDIPLVWELSKTLQPLGLQAIWQPGEVVDLWPEEAAQEIELDRSPGGATMVRVEILASGWQRGTLVVCRPRGRLLEVIDEADP